VPDRYEVTLQSRSGLEGDDRPFRERMSIDLGIYRAVPLSAGSDLRDLSKHVKTIADSASTWTSRFPEGLQIVTNEDMRRRWEQHDRDVESELPVVGDAEPPQPAD
jgi:hypothetical protein